MKEDMINNLRQQDNNLREAIRQEEVERPRMSVNLNERLMAKVATEQPKRSHAVWWWSVAACASVVLAVLLTPPKTTGEIANVEPKVEDVSKPMTDNMVQEPKVTLTEQARTLPQEMAVAPIKASRTIQHEECETGSDVSNTLVAQVQTPTDTSTIQDTPHEAMPTDVAAASAPSEVLTESDFPVTRPENYKYTKEEIALMKKQANDAYIKWVELEIEIAKFNLEQMAKSDN